MKKLSLFVLAILAGAVSAFAQTETKSYTVSNFTSIDASHYFTIELTQGRNYSLSIEAPETIFDMIRVNQNGKVLNLALKEELPKKLRDLKEAITVKITMPSIEEIELSGACKLYGKGDFSCSGKEFKLELDGASRIEDLNIVADEMEIDLSGASRAEINVDARELSADLSGSSKLVVTGKASKMEMEISGVSALDTKKAECNEMELEESGACKSVVYVKKKLKVDLSGASKCEYFGPEDLNLRIDSISGASTIKRLK